MIILAIDVGNTHIEVGLFNKKEYITSWRIATGVHRTEDEMFTFLNYFLNQKNIKLKDVNDVIISSVVPNVTQIFQKLCKNYFKKDAFIVDHTVDSGLKINYNPPSNVGADRICNAVAAYEKYGGPTIIVDFGTATTLDVVDQDGKYLGGAIAPGLEMTASSLYERTAKLPKISLEYPETIIGKTTEHSMQAGIMFGTIKMVDGLIELMKKEISGNVKVVATGGLANHILSKSLQITHAEPNLVLEGLIKIYFRNYSK
jgi:type III pantothenate kinase